MLNCVSGFAISGHSLLKLVALLTPLLLLTVATASIAEQIGSANAKYSQLGKSQRLVLEAFADPEVSGVTCYISRASEGGLAQSLAVTQPGDAAIACVQTATIDLPRAIKNGSRNGEEVFSDGTLVGLSNMKVLRFYDTHRQVLLYMSYSLTHSDGSPQNSVSAVAVRAHQ